MKQLILPILFSLLCGVLLSTSTVQAQRTCATDDLMEQMRIDDPAQAARIDEQKRKIYQYAKTHGNASRMDTIYTIPVVFHVVWNDSVENISDEQIQSQIEVLNEDFRHRNADSINTPMPFLQVAGDAKIEFCLATFDPDGNFHSGITRTQTTLTTFGGGNAVKSNATGGHDPWPNDQYLNFWVCNLGGGLLGFATGPGSDPASDGIVCRYQSVGRVGELEAPYDLGRTATHEIGHWLGLDHVWGSGAGGCSIDDNVADTPLQASDNGGCPSFPSVSCMNGPNGDQFMNYLDYTDDDCMNMFSQGQVAVMRAALNPSGPRWPLFNSTACVNPAYNNVGVDTILSPFGVNCGGEISIEVILENFGQNAVTETPIYFVLDGQPLGIEFWTGNLNVGATTNVFHLPATIGPGIHTLSAYTEGANNALDPDLSNDTATIQFEVLNNIGSALPYANGFEDPDVFVPSPTSLEIVNPDNATTWQRRDDVSRWGTASIWMNNYDYDSIGAVDEFIIPDIDLTTFAPTGVGLSFYVAYAKYAVNTGFSDTLEVWVSSDCGVTYELRYKKFDTDLITSGYTTDSFEPQYAWQWRKEWIDLTDLNTETGVSIKFRNIANYENNLYLDNINLGVLYTVDIEDELATGIVTIYPNPAHHQVTVSVDAVSQADMRLTMRDATGREVLTRGMQVSTGSNQVDLSVAGFARGVYFVEVADGQSSVVQKLVIL